LGIMKRGQEKEPTTHFTYNKTLHMRQIPGRRSPDHLGGGKKEPLIYSVSWQSKENGVWEETRVVIRRHVRKKGKCCGKKNMGQSRKIRESG